MTDGVALWKEVYSPDGLMYENTTQSQPQETLSKKNSYRKKKNKQARVGRSVNQNAGQAKGGGKDTGKAKGGGKEKEQAKRVKSRPPTRPRVHPELHAEIKHLDVSWREVKDKLYRHGRDAVEWGKEKYRNYKDSRNQSEDASESLDYIAYKTDDLISILEEMNQNFVKVINDIKARTETSR